MAIANILMTKIIKVEFDPLKPDYWVNQKVTMPKIPVADWVELLDGPEEVKKLRESIGKPMLITHVEVDTDGTAEHAYYGFVTENGFSSNMNFDIFPPEMAVKFGFAGWEHFGKKIPLKR